MSNSNSKTACCAMRYVRAPGRGKVSHIRARVGHSQNGSGEQTLATAPDTPNRDAVTTTLRAIVHMPSRRKRRPIITELRSRRIHGRPELLIEAFSHAR